MNEKKFFTAIDPANRKVLLELKKKNIDEYKATLLELKAVWTARGKEWRKDGMLVKEDKPLKVWKARQYGWKDKPGFVVVRGKINKGRRKRRQTDGGRKPSKSYMYKTPDKSLQAILEERVCKKFPNCEVLVSYWLWEDGQNKWFEIILVDAHNPHIKRDKDLNELSKKRGRAGRGLTPAGKKSRGLRKKGKGSEKTR